MDPGATGRISEKGYRVRGHVQGVGFRWWARNQALHLGLAGSVCNQPDGTVEVHVRGPDDEVARFREQLAAGPPGAHVAAVEEIPVDGVSADGFRILH